MGITWGIGAISNSQWEGVKLKDIIKQQIINQDDY